MTEWTDAFSGTVLNRLRADPAAVQLWTAYRETRDIDPIKAMAKRGQLSPDDDFTTALWAAFRYQRGHADAFKQALQRHRYAPVGHRTVFDIGCGAGTVAVAFHELLAEHASNATVAYVGYDPNPSAVDLGSELLATLTDGSGGVAPTLTTDLRRAVSDVCREVATGKRPILAISYLLSQDALSYEDVEGIALALAIVSVSAFEAGFARVPLLITNALYPPGKFAALHAQLAAHVAVEGDVTPDVFSSSIPFPNLYPETEGWFRRVTRTDNVASWLLALRPR